MRLRWLRWGAVDACNGRAGPFPEWLTLDGRTGQMTGRPPKPTDEPISLEIEVSDGNNVVGQPLHLTVLPAQPPEAHGTWWRPRLSRVDLGTWLEQGVGFLVLWLVHLLGMNLLANHERNSLDGNHFEQSDASILRSLQRRYRVYRLLVRLTTITAMAALAVWMVMSHRS